MNKVHTNMERKRNLLIQLSQLVYEELTMRSIFPHGKLNTPKKLAKVFPTSKTLAESDMDTEDFKQININYWSRISREERPLMDSGLIKRIGEEFPEMKEILGFILYEILCDPFSSVKKLNRLIQKLALIFEDLLFVSNGKELIQKRYYWARTSLNLIANENFLAYQLILMRMMALKKFQKHPYLSPKHTTLLLLRVLIATPLKKIAHTILKEYYYFYLANAKALGMKVLSISDQHIDNNTLFYVIEMCFPEAKKLPYMQSFSAYNEYHYELQMKANEVFFGVRNLTISDTFSKNTLYWADRNCDLWLSNSIEKISLYNKESPMLKQTYIALFDSEKNFRIW